MNCIILNTHLHIPHGVLVKFLKNFKINYNFKQFDQTKYSALDKNVHAIKSPSKFQLSFKKLIQIWGFMRSNES